VRVDGLYLSGVGAQVPPPMPARVAVELGLYDRAAFERDGWTGAAVAGDTPAPDLAVAAARRALARSGPVEVALVLHACFLHQGPDAWPAAHYVQRHTVGGSAPAMEIRQGCNGMLGAIELAAAHLTATGADAALVTGADNFGAPLVDRWSYATGARTNRGSILGDAGTAVVLSRRPATAQLLAVGSASLPDLEEMYRGGHPLFPPAVTIGGTLDLGARIAHFADREPEAFAQAKKSLAETRTLLAHRVLAEAGAEPHQITRATHVFSGGERYVRSVLEPLGIDPGRGMLDFGRTVGHLGVSDHIAALDHLLSTRAVTTGDHVLMLANGAGLALSCAVLRIL
jgi:3-oxoacyl-[acyl-carrier-protein] synthase III